MHYFFEINKKSLKNKSFCKNDFFMKKNAKIARSTNLFET